MAIITEELFQTIPGLSDSEHSIIECSDIESLLKDAFESPINYPLLTESIFPGDRVAILVQNQLPAARETLESLIRVLEASRIETQNILVVVAAGMAKAFNLVQNPVPEDAESGVPATWHMKDDDRTEPLCFEVHVGDDEQAASYLAANKQGNPVYVNRSLCDCDVVLPLSCLSPHQKNKDCLYPEFSTDDTKDRYRQKEDSKEERIAEAMLANDALGLFFTIELVCGPGGVIDKVVCGERTEARKAALGCLEPLWQLEQPEDCDAVVTTIETSAEFASWSNVIRAVNAAASFTDEGPIVVWTELSEKPNAKVKKACSAQFEGSVPDSLSTKLQHFASILCERPVYLRSKLSQNVVEGLGLGYVESAESVERIMRPYSKPMLIRDGHLR